MSSVKGILLFEKFPVTQAISFPASLYRLASATKNYSDLNLTRPIAVIRPLLTGRNKFILKEVVRTKASSKIELTTKNVGLD